MGPASSSGYPTLYYPRGCSANVLASYVIAFPTNTRAAWPSDDACDWSSFGPWLEANCYSNIVEVYNSVALGLDIQYGMLLPNGSVRSWAASSVVLKEASNPGQHSLMVCLA